MFDPEHGVAASASRRVFQLVGESGRHPEAERMWARWKGLNALQQERDVTPGFFKAMGAWQGNAVA
jgi:hypothetical protein